jgi:hypothetical protein
VIFLGIARPKRSVYHWVRGNIKTIKANKKELKIKNLELNTFGVA